MDKKKVLEEFYNQVGDFLTSHNFKLNKSQSIAKRKTEFGFDSLFFDVNDMIDNYSITTALRIRHDEIQEVKGEVNPRYKNRKETSTVLERVFTLLKRYDKLELEYEIENPGNLVNEKTLEPYLAAFRRFMNEVGFSFFNSFKTIKDFDNWFNSPLLNGTYNFDRGLNWNNSISGLITAKFSKNPRYQEICDKWASGVPSEDTETLTELESTKKYLDALTSN